MEYWSIDLTHHSTTPLLQSFLPFALPHYPVRYRPPDAQSFLERPQNLTLNLVCGGELLHQLVADIAVLGIRLAMFGKEFDVALIQSIVILERPEEPTAG